MRAAQTALDRGGGLPDHRGCDIVQYVAFPDQHHWRIHP
jgi:hypothetical protein